MSYRELLVCLTPGCYEQFRSPIYSLCEICCRTNLARRQSARSGRNPNRVCVDCGAAGISAGSLRCRACWLAVAGRLPKPDGNPALDCRICYVRLRSTDPPGRICAECTKARGRERERERRQATRNRTALICASCRARPRGKGRRLCRHCRATPAPKPGQAKFTG